MNINANFFDLEESYLFAAVAKKAAEYKKRNPDKTVYSLGIGDVTLPLVPAVTDAMQKAVIEMSDIGTFRGYGDYEGYGFLRQSICGYYAGKAVALDETEVFISDGAKSDLGNILDIFSADNHVLIPDPVYPVYVDTNIMAGRKISFISGSRENGFLPLPDHSVRPDIIYLCSPNNPTGAVYNSEQLKEWVDYARKYEAVILFDSAYEAFVQDADLPTSIYQIEGAKECVIEFCSLSKTAEFTGTRCGYTVIPHALRANGADINRLWLRRQSTKFNGVPYIIQRGAEAVFTDAGLAHAKANIRYYMQNAHTIGNGLKELGIWFTGGENSPYIWLECPRGLSSWEFFDLLLTKANVIGTPGSGFGLGGEGYFRLTAFGGHDSVTAAMENIRRLD